MEALDTIPLWQGILCVAGIALLPCLAVQLYRWRQRLRTRRQELRTRRAVWDAGLMRSMASFEADRSASARLTRPGSRVEFPTTVHADEESGV